MNEASIGKIERLPKASRNKATAGPLLGDGSLSSEACTKEEAAASTPSWGSDEADVRERWPPPRGVQTMGCLPYTGAEIPMVWAKRFDMPPM